MTTVRQTDYQQQLFEKHVDGAGYKMYSEFLNFLHT